MHMKKTNSKNRSNALLSALPKSNVCTNLYLERYAVYGDHIIATDSFRLHSGLNRGAPDGIYNPVEIGHYEPHGEGKYPPLEQLQGIKDTKNNEKASLKELYNEVETASFEKLDKTKIVEFRGHKYDQQYLLDAIEHMYQQSMGMLDEVNISINEHGKITLTSEEMDTAYAVVMNRNS